MKQIRFGTFETNSSSTHSLIICTDAEYEAWRCGDAILDWDIDKIVPMPSDKELEEEDWRYIKYANYYDRVSMETFEETYTTPHGDVIHVFGWYGYDG